MDKKTVFAQFFRSISVHLPKAGSDCYYFRSIPVQFEGINAGRNIFPDHIRSLLLDIRRTQMLFFSGPYPFKESVSSVTFVLGNQQNPVHQWQELSKI